MHHIEQYFEHDDTQPTDLNTDDLPLSTTHPALDMDVRALVAYIKRALPDLTPTPRALARILHGIGSPAWPASQWSKHVDWGRRKDVAFESVMRCAEEVLRENSVQGEEGEEEEDME